VRYSTSVPGGRLYVENTSLLFDMWDVQTIHKVYAAHSGNTQQAIPPPATLQCHAYRVHLEGMVPGTAIDGNFADGTAYNYYMGNDPGKWSSELKGYAEVRYANVYAHTDLKIYSKGTLKYDFVVKPGGDPRAIALRYEGVKPKLLKSGALEIPTSVGFITESKPFAYQYIHGEFKVVPCAYELRGQVLRFAVGAYDPAHELVIDPELVFSTFSGSTADNFGYTATYDLQGNLYGGSSAFGNGYPVSTGAYQSAWAGGSGAGNLVGTDIAISKFNQTGTQLLYSTYLGGSGDDIPNSLVTDSIGNLYILGTTGSANYPTTAGCYQPNFAGGGPIVLGGLGIAFPAGSDMVVTALNPNGSALLASTYVGGSANDGVNSTAALRYNYADEVRGEIDIDPDGNILVGSTTFSANFPMLPGAFQPVKGVGQEGVVFKLTPQLNGLLASTFFGASGADAIYSIDVRNGRILAGGGTTSTDLGIPTAAHQQAYAGGQADGFLAEFNNELTTLLGATYYGSTGYDQIYFAEYDKQGRPHAYGQTTAQGNALVFNATYSIPNSGMLLAKFNSGLQSLQWSTVFGNGNNIPNLSPTAFSVDLCNRIYLAGWGGTVNFNGSANGLPITPDALKSTTNGSDFYLMVLDADAGGLTYASFFGGNTSPEHVDGGTSRFDRTGKVYQAVCAGCGGSSDFPIQPGNAVSPTNNSSNCNLGVAKIDFDLPLALASFTAQEVCLPGPVTFTNTSNTYTGAMPNWLWNFGDGNTSTLANPSHVYAQAGTYTVQLVLADPMSCNLVDTFATNITVFPEVLLELPTTLESCSSTEFTITAQTQGTASLYTWSSNPAFTSILLQGPEATTYTATTPTNTTVYVQVSNGPCSATGAVDLVPPPTLSLSGVPTLLCAVDTIDAEAIIGGGGQLTSIVWQPESLVVSGQGTPTAGIAALAPFTLQVSIESQHGCSLSANVDVGVYPVALSVPADVLSCTDDPVVLTANAFGTAESFVWSNSPDFSNPINNPADSSITVVPGETTLYFVQIENNGCTLSESVAVSLLGIAAVIRPDQYICQGDTALVYVTPTIPGGMLTFSWSPDELIISGQGTASILAVVNETTTFTVVTAADGCETESSTVVETSPLGAAVVSATASPLQVLSGQSTTLMANPFNEQWQYQWAPTDGLATPLSAQTTATPTATTTYTVSIFDIKPNGVCQKDAPVTVTVYDAVCGEPFIFVPNAFSPNGDGENDRLLVRGQNITELDFKVFNRWGELVFETSDQQRGWDGTFKGRAAEPAVFVYHLKARCGDGQEYFAKGNVTLLR
jgi:gliding motility-associated-like protein